MRARLQYTLFSKEGCAVALLKNYSTLVCPECCCAAWAQRTGVTIGTCRPLRNGSELWTCTSDAASVPDAPPLALWGIAALIVLVAALGVAIRITRCN
jgi:hypothetical protein